MSLKKGTITFCAILMNLYRFEIGKKRSNCCDITTVEEDDCTVHAVGSRFNLLKFEGIK
jgi:hypothetical protein